MRSKKSVCLILVSLFLIPLLASVVPRSAASPSLTDRDVIVWNSPVLAEPRLVAMSADGRYIVAAEDSGGQNVCLLDANQNLKWNFSVASFEVSRVPLDQPYVTWVDISDNGSYMAFGGYYAPGGVGYGFVFLFSQAGLVWAKTDFTYGGGPAQDTDCSGAISGDGSRIAVGYVLTIDGNSSLEVYDDAGAFRWGYVVPADSGGTLGSVSISSDGKYVALGTTYGIYLVHEGILAWVDYSTYWFWPVRISRDGSYVLGYRAEDKNIVYYDHAGSLVWHQTVDPSVVDNWDYDLAISGDGQFAVATGNSTIYFFDHSGLRWTYDTNVVDINQVKISADGYFIVATATWSGATESDIFHLNRWGKLIWQIPQAGDHFYVIPGGALGISANGEYFCSTQYSTYVNTVDRYFSKKYFNYRFVTVDPAPLPISNLDVRWSFTNGTLYSSTWTNSSGWITFFDPHFVDYSTEAYYWQTKVGQYTPLVKAYQYETVSDHTASLFDWTITLHDVSNNPVTARIETYLWNGTLYDNRTASSVKFEDLPNQTYTFRVYYPNDILSYGPQATALTQEEQNSTMVIDTLPPLIAAPLVAPWQPSPTDTVKISVNVTDDLSGVHNVTLSYRLNTTLPWTNVTMTYNSTSTFYEASIQPQPAGTDLTFIVTANDYTGKQSVSDNDGVYFRYIVTPEFAAMTTLLILLVATAPILLIVKRRRNNSPRAQY